MNESLKEKVNYIECMMDIYAFFFQLIPSCPCMLVPKLKTLFDSFKDIIECPHPLEIVISSSIPSSNIKGEVIS